MDARVAYDCHIREQPDEPGARERARTSYRYFQQLEGPRRQKEDLQVSVAHDR